VAVLASFLGAFLLFALQPLIGKSLLPLYGGGAGPWIATMLFFQLVLLAGYGYAHALARRLGTPWALPVHGGLALVALGVLALGFRTGGAPWIPAASTVPGSGFPPVEILATLALCAGAPLVLLAATSPLVQAAFARLEPGRDPYRLYAVSNAGSLGGLLCYPFLLEPVVDLNVQAWASAVLFLVYLGVLFSLLRRVPVQPPECVVEDQDARGPITWRSRFTWVGLSALGTLWLCAVTNHISAEVASIPLLWIPPLALYLLTFILVFETRWSFDGPGWRVGLMVLVGILAVILGLPAFSLAMTESLGNGTLASIMPALNVVQWFKRHLPWLVTLMIVAGACGALLAHGRLAAARPPARHLTAYYLCMSLGGALGGLFVSMAGPLIFNQDHELSLAILLTGLLVVFSFRRSQTRLKWAGLALGAGAAALALFTIASESLDRRIYHGRDFFGSLTVNLLHPKVIALAHGSTVHGIQFVKEPLRPASYYGQDSGIGVVLRTLAAERPAMKVGLVGLGVGNTAAFGRATDEYVFFEISPKVIEVAGPEGTFFSVLKSTPAKVRVLQGDGRLLASQEAKTHGRYDVLLIDAFAGGSIPAHLLTVEALRGYVAALKPDGLLVLHVSHDLPLATQVGANLRAAGLSGTLFPHAGVMGQARSGQKVLVEHNSTYWIAAPSPGLVLRPEFLAGSKRVHLSEDTAAYPPEIETMRRKLDVEIQGVRPWTDQRHGLAPLLIMALRGKPEQKP